MGRSASAQVIVFGGRAYVVDCGDGVARQLVHAGVALKALRHVFVTHHHSDHNADYGNLLLLAWTTGLSTRVDTWGPPPISTITRQFFAMSAVDIETRIADEGRTPVEPLVVPHDVDRTGVLFDEEGVRATAAVVPHPLMAHALAYRLDTPDRSIVISGDTARSDALIALARGADVLVHEAMWVPAIERLAARVPSAAGLAQHLRRSHTSAEDCGHIAAEAGVKTLVLSHLVPPDDPDITPAMWRDAAARAFGGTIVVGEDLMEL